MSQQQQKPQPDEAREWAKRLRDAADAVAKAEGDPSITHVYAATFDAATAREFASLLESQAERIEVLAGQVAERDAATKFRNGIETDSARLQLRNVLALATRLKRRLARGEAVCQADLDHFIRFAANADVMPTILRATKEQPK
jgi:hypothetical protein